MAKHQRLTKSRGPYRLRARAEAMAKTRQRITEAAVELHGTVGPAATTMTAIAARAGITRATLYRHFATEQEVFAACSSAWLAVHPRPDLAAWAAIDDPPARVATALRDLYAYYRSSQAMLGNLLRDIACLPEMTALNLASYPGQMLDVLDRGWPGGDNERVRRAATLHALSFETWRSFATEGLSDEEAASLMLGLVTAASGEPEIAEPA